ncbi:hypothetical protein [Arthrobacter sp. UYEF21]|uniref:hypothetical protein n=1 Tax=Arthrobacter sp. UYEF21 TaxID=1756364 RepID=UPI00339290A0
MTSEFVPDLMGGYMPLNEVHIIEPQDPKCRFLVRLQADAAGSPGMHSQTLDGVRRPLVER